MDDFSYRNGELRAEGVPLRSIAEAVGTPAYVYAASGMRRRLRRLQDAFAGQRATFCYAIKANSNLAVIRTDRWKYVHFAAMPPLYHVGQPEEVADVIVFLASHQARFITGQRITMS
jgi:NAD(P)-dependent dehydrogenase (short-subunit alcohol dehydrogenase family)